jgi:hypothetical protein
VRNSPTSAVHIEVMRDGRSPIALFEVDSHTDPGDLAGRIEVARVMAKTERCELRAYDANNGLVGTCKLGVGRRRHKARGPASPDETAYALLEVLLSTNRVLAALQHANEHLRADRAMLLHLIRAGQKRDSKA